MMEGARLRDQRPCDNCRRRKIRCLFSSDVAVNCVLCVSRSIQCTYVESAPRKKRITSPNDDKAQPAPPSRPKKRVKAQNSNDRAADESVLKDYTQLPGRSLLKKTLGHQNRQTSAVLGSTSDFDTSLARSLLWNEKGECAGFDPPHILRRASQRTYFMVKQDSQDEIDAEIANLDMIEDLIHPHGRELVNLYFRIVHPSFPILHKRVFLEKYGRSYRELTPCGLGAVYILALNWWSYSPALAVLQKPDAEALEAMVLRMLFEAHRRPKISDLQGALVLMQRPNMKSWALTGHVVAMAQTLGINADCTSWKVPDWERGVRKRVAWALFMQDKWGALIYGRGSHIKWDDWDVRPLEYSDFPETAEDDDDEEGSAEIEKGKQTFLQMVSLTEIVAEILDQFFTLKAVARQRSLSQVLEAAKPLQLKLKSWHSGIPSTLSVDETVPRKLSSVGYLHLAYYTAEVTLHRAILRSYSLANPNPNPELYSITRAAATARFLSALAFVKCLRAEHFQSFWYFSSSHSLAIIGLFAGILCATLHDGEQEERNMYISKFAEYRWVLRISAASAEFLKSAVGMLDAKSQLLERQLVTDAAQSTGTHQMGNSMEGSPYVGEEEDEDEEENIGDEGYFNPLSSNVDFFSPPKEDGEQWQQPPALEMTFDNLDWEDLGDFGQDLATPLPGTADVARGFRSSIME